MARRRHRVRIEFLVALTLVVLAYGAFLLVRHYTSARRAEELQPLQVRLAESLTEYRSALTGEARKSPGTSQRHAAALLVQLRRILEEPPQESAARVDRFQTLYRQWQSGRSPEFPRGEPFLRGYLAEQDASIRPYSITVPEDYEAGLPTALLVSLTAGGEQEPAAPVYSGAVSVAPVREPAPGAPFPAERDVLAIVEDARALYSIDPDRIYLTGRGMGGQAAWLLAARHPDLFRGVAPFAAPTSHEVWQRVGNWNPEAPGQAAEVRRFLHARYSPLSYASNLLRTPAAVLHATGDAVVPVAHPRAMLAELQSAGGRTYYREFPGGSHDRLPGSAYDDAMGWLFARVPSGAPGRIAYRTDGLRHNSAWWVEVDRVRQPLDFAEVDARLEQDAAVLELQNVQAATVRLDALPRPVKTVRIGDASLEVSERTGDISFRRQGDGWAVAERPREGKRRGCSGPFAEVFNDRFILVYGTSGSSRMMQTVCRREAERFRRYWQRRYGSAPRVMRDVDVGRSDMDDAHMVLIGGPDINAQTAQLADALPVEFEDEGFRFGGRLYTEPDQGLLLCYPHPDRPGRLVALAHGNSPAPLFQSLDRFGLWVYGGVLGSREWFDFGVFDARTAGPETFLHVGFFDNEWKPPGAGSGGWELRRGGQGPATAEQGFPEFHTVSEAAVARGEAADSLHLSDLLPERIDQPIGAVGINRAYDGGPVHMGMAVYEKGLGVKVPSRISYHLGGMYDQFSSVVTLTHGFKGEPMGARREHEKVVFEVWGDGKLLVQSSELDWVAKHRMATRINADIRDVFELELVVRPVGDAPTWLYGAAAWCAPVISR